MTPHDAEVQAEILRLFQLTPHAAVVPWLEQHIVIPARMSPNSAGPFRTALRPFMRPILECWNPESGVNHCGVSGGTQLLKTTVLCLGASYRVCNSPLPALIVGSSNSWTKTEISEKRLQPLIDENPILAAEKPHSSDQYRAMSMAMSGGHINLVGGNSPGALSGGSYGIVAIDEASKLIHQGSDQAPEAHPFLLAEKRTDGFGALAFHYRSSTPNSPTHPFWHYILAGDQTRFHVPCPHCHEWFYLDFIGRVEDREEYATNLGITLPSHYQSLIWSPDARDKSGQWNEDKVRETTTYICPHNGCEIREVHKQPMIDECAEKRHNHNAAANRRSFIIPSFYSPTMSFGGMSWAFLDSLKDFFGLQDYHNSRLARPWSEQVANVKTEDVRKLRDISHYRRGIIPCTPVALFSGSDVGDYKTHWINAAIFENDEIAIIDWGTVLTPEDLIPASTTWKYQVANTSTTLQVSRGLIDSADQSVRVYNMCQASRGFWWPAAGSDSRSGSWGFTPLKTHQLDRYTFNTFQFKKELYINLIQKQKSPRIYLPQDADEDLIAGLSGQQLITVKGKEEFKKIPNDHYGDCLLRILLARIIYRAEHGHGAPDIPPEPDPSDPTPTGRDYILKQP
ncbi:terminase gpA endonuclease subunit [Prosthecobacter sp.]|uniref:terminase gpA endonuclease subunit n=1 Tax=Prosthecobacter sp. TaxID=1965333 RepID=UPI003784C885